MPNTQSRIAKIKERLANIAEKMNLRVLQTKAAIAHYSQVCSEKIHRGISRTFQAISYFFANAPRFIAKIFYWGWKILKGALRVGYDLARNTYLVFKMLLTQIFKIITKIPKYLHILFKKALQIIRYTGRHLPYLIRSLFRIGKAVINGLYQVACEVIKDLSVLCGYVLKNLLPIIKRILKGLFNLILNIPRYIHEFGKLLYQAMIIFKDLVIILAKGLKTITTILLEEGFDFCKLLLKQCFKGMKWLLENSVDFLLQLIGTVGGVFAYLLGIKISDQKEKGVLPKKSHKLRAFASTEITLLDHKMLTPQFKHAKQDLAKEEQAMSPISSKRSLKRTALA